MKLLSMPVVLVIFVLTVLLDWYFAYAVIFQPSVIMTAWSVILPFLSVFYFAFSIVTITGIYQAKQWAFPLASFAVVIGAVFSTLSFGLTYGISSSIENLYMLLLVWNFISLVFLGVYYFFKHE